ncbi:hypothetical protein DFH08DRAFT_827725 [Mycena albidolilacea]|uniref:Uncharacterized protein n=1 Tax=Mycena albidolilacea TaxID=1033008 RepID=A0AAD7E6Z3_9AGAR|nr:hypothetical protein DFH08DRAFT_827725 [Mycena albidolilacea]
MRWRGNLAQRKMKKEQGFAAAVDGGRICGFLDVLCISIAITSGGGEWGWKDAEIEGKMWDRDGAEEGGCRGRKRQRKGHRPHKKGVVSFAREAVKMSQAHASLCKEKRGHTKSIHTADSVAQKRPRAATAHQAACSQRGCTSRHGQRKDWVPQTPREVWCMDGHASTPVSAPLRRQNGWRLEAPSRLESTCRRMRLKPNTRPYAGQERHIRTACDSSPYRTGQHALLYATECQHIQIPTPQSSAPPYSVFSSDGKVRFGSGPRYFFPNAEPEPRVRFKEFSNLNLNLAFGVQAHLEFTKPGSYGATVHEMGRRSRQLTAGLGGGTAKGYARFGNSSNLNPELGVQFGSVQILDLDLDRCRGGWGH